MWVIIACGAALLGFAVGWFLRQHLGQQKLARAYKLAEKVLEEARAEGEDLKREKLLEAQDETFKQKQQLEQEHTAKLAQIQTLEQQLSNREVNLDRKVDILNKKDRELQQQADELRRREDAVRVRNEELDGLIAEENKKLEQISGLSSEQAREIQLKNVLEQARQEATEEAQEIKDKARQRANEEAQQIVLQAIQRCAISHVVESTITSITLPDDEMKGRIIGREGRNIRSFESATGIEVLIDDTPQTVTLSGFDPIRREIARQAMEKLIHDGRIHPGRIEEVVARTRDEINEKIMEMGEHALHDLGIHGVHNELVRLLGRQHYRMHYGQNLLQHSKEVAFLAGEMASQLGLDVGLARRAGILHDIGQTAEEYSDAPPHEIGLELVKKFDEGPVVQNVVERQGNPDVPVASPISVLVDVANSVSISRPGARKEMLDNYLKRMHKFEKIARSFKGVVASYAIQAGKEMRVIVEHNVVDDAQARILCEEITKKVKKEVDFPGQIKVIVIREFRAIDYAK